MLVLAALWAAVNVVPYPAFLLFVNVLPYVTVPITSLFVHAVVLGVIVINEFTSVFECTTNALDIFTCSALFPATSVTFVHKYHIPASLTSVLLTVSPFLKVFHDVGSVVFDVDHAYCNVFNPLPPVSAAFNVVFIVASPLVGIVYAPPLGLNDTVGKVISCLYVVTEDSLILPALSIALTYILFEASVFNTPCILASVPFSAKLFPQSSFHVLLS